MRDSDVTPSLFDAPHYAHITRARLEHLDWMQLPFDGRSVLDAGSGIGRFSEFFIERGCDLTCIDGRPANVAALQRYYPGLRALVADVETDSLEAFGTFDVLFCYGLLYHLADPLGFLKRAAAICRDFAVIETCIMDAPEPLLRLIHDRLDDTQSLHGLGCRPSPHYMRLALLVAGFRHVYVPRSAPEHPEFAYEWLGDGSHLRHGQAMRQIYVASRSEMVNERLHKI